MRILASTLLLALAAPLLPMSAQAEPPSRPNFPPQVLPAAAMLDPGMQCRQAIRNAERMAGIPTQLMAAIGRVESGRPDAQGVVSPWPWTINAEGEGHYYASKAEAIAAVQVLQARGVRSVDVGCMQVNLMHHPDAFASLDQAFDPVTNAAYAARFLNQLFAQTGSWTQATAYYHSATPELGADYERKVAAVLPEEQRRLGLTAGTATGNVWSNNVWSRNVWNTHGPAWPPMQGVARPPVLTAGVAGGGNMLSNNAGNARLLPAAAGTVGRGLAAYRAAPIPVASRRVPPAPM